VEGERTVSLPLGCDRMWAGAVLVGAVAQLAKLKTPQQGHRPEVLHKNELHKNVGFSGDQQIGDAKSPRGPSAYTSPVQTFLYPAAVLYCTFSYTAPVQDLLLHSCNASMQWGIETQFLLSTFGTDLVPAPSVGGALAVQRKGVPPSSRDLKQVQGTKSIPQQPLSAAVSSLQ